MIEEMFDIYDGNMNSLGMEKRNVVHQKGYWHKSFHCWFYQIEDGVLYILFQKRQSDKDTHPNLLDISAAGHLTAGERPEEGIREVEEELGVKVSMEDLEWIDVIRGSYTGNGVIDNEYCYTYLYHYTKPITDLAPDIKEVAGIYMIPFHDFNDLYYERKKSLKVSGFEYEKDQLVNRELQVEKNDFVPHPHKYYRIILGELAKIDNTL